MSRALESLLDAVRRADCAANDKALSVDRGPASAVSGDSFDVVIAAIEAGAQRVEVITVQGLDALRRIGAI